MPMVCSGFSKGTSLLIYAQDGTTYVNTPFLNLKACDIETSPKRFAGAELPQVRSASTLSIIRRSEV